MKQVVITDIATTEQAERVVYSLRNAGFRSTKISVLMPNISELQGLHTAAAGGSALGWLAGIEAINIPGIGPLVAAGPLAAALCDTPGGILKQDVIEVLVGLGVAELEAKQHFRNLSEGHAILYVHVESNIAVRQVETIFRDCDIATISSNCLISQYAIAQ